MTLVIYINEYVCIGFGVQRACIVPVWLVHARRSLVLVSTGRSCRVPTAVGPDRSGVVYCDARNSEGM